MHATRNDHVPGHSMNINENTRPIRNKKICVVTNQLPQCKTFERQFILIFHLSAWPLCLWFYSCFRFHMYSNFLWYSISPPCIVRCLIFDDETMLPVVILRNSKLKHFVGFHGEVVSVVNLQLMFLTNSYTMLLGMRFFLESVTFYKTINKRLVLNEEVTHFHRISFKISSSTITVAITS